MTPKSFLRWVSLNLMIKGHPVAALLFCAEHIIAEFVVPENTCERPNARCRGTEELFFTKMTRLSLLAYIYNMCVVNFISKTFCTLLGSILVFIILN